MDYIKDLRKLVGKMPVILVGSVVIILDENKHILLQQRTHPYGVWGLPGGLMELGESSEETAIREVKEETGLTVSRLKLHHLFSGERFFTVAANGDPFYSVTAVYYTSTYHGSLVLNKEEAIQLAFFPSYEMPDTMVGSHREFIDDYFKR
ncbi:NUDIX hydrolase [Niallia nealsonii]|uniref:DNA mismatch repair protein MutT n=1 Tax=Niallia nealsonii TaxID=115979 RepID=A0A2N0Z614_9BACI|nr:NUDIX hydrolase [Niallia nealsonii]PKG24940.1 DNA mismatch repair protein MutT [Niallia nealsonii]